MSEANHKLRSSANMSKTPEQDKGCVASQLAEEYINHVLESQCDCSYRIAFLAGYQAAMNSPEKPDTCEHILDMEKMVDADKVINGNTSDGYHTFNELYEHRHYLFIALMYALQTQGRTWISSKHADQSSFDGSFIAGINLPTGPITYHLPNRLWIACVGAETKVLIQAPPWDGHTSTDVLNRLARYSAGICDEVAPPFVDKVINSSNNLNGWISVKERLPPPETEVLWWNKTAHQAGVSSWQYKSYCNDTMIYWGDAGNVSIKNFTHWMPLPKPPEEKK